MAIALRRASGNTTSYNPNFPWLTESNYRKMEDEVNKMGLTGSAKNQAMNQWYRSNVNYLLNDQTLDERDDYINQQAYEAAKLQNTQANAQLRMTEASQMAKRQWNLQADANDVDIFSDMVANLWENWMNLAWEYLEWKSQEFLYACWLRDRPIEDNRDDTIQWGIKWRIADASDNTKWQWFLPNWWEAVLNPVWRASEVFDNWAKWVADKITVGKKARENLVEKINNMSEEDMEQYKQRYEQSWYNGSLQDYIIDVNKTRWQDLVGADEELKGIAEPNVFKFFGNIPASTLRLISSTVKASTNPVDTLVWLYHVVWSPEGREALKQRYWTAQWWADAMNYDSVGTAEEILSVAHSMWWLVKWFWHLAKLPWVESVGNTIMNNVGSPVDVAVDRALYGWNITYWTSPDNMKSVDVKWLYWAMDDLAWDSKVLWAINRYAQDTSSTQKLLENAAWDLQAVREKANSRANDIIQNNNRMTKKQQEKFVSMIWEDQGKWMNDRWLKTAEDVANYFLESKNKVDNAMANIEWTFTSDKLTRVLDDVVEFAKDTDNPDLKKFQALQRKNLNGWLTMSEINDVKRFFERNNKFTYLKSTDSKGSVNAQKATNRDTELRQWQQDIAAENWLTNLKELNKETQAAKFITDNATNWQSGVKWNNPISLTDWIVFAWDGISTKSLEWLVSKKIFQAPWFQDKLVDVLNYIWWHEVKDTINPDMKAIELKNYEKRILAEELAKVQSEQDFNNWLNKAQEMAWPALPYNPAYNWAPTTTITATPWWQSIRQWQIAEINGGLQM